MRPGSREPDTRPVGVVDRLFVYGSLRTGESARALVEPYVRDCEPATVRGAMFALAAGYPGVVLDAGGSIIRGELIGLRDLAEALRVLDDYEGSDYERVMVEAEHVGGPSWAWVYVLADPGLAALGTPVPGGEWSARAIAS